MFVCIEVAVLSLFEYPFVRTCFDDDTLELPSESAHCAFGDVNWHKNRETGMCRRNNRFRSWL